MEARVQATKAHKSDSRVVHVYLLYSSSTKRIHSPATAVCGLWAVELPAGAGCCGEGECKLGGFVPELS